jgi:HD-GYP domain-containing protein (c-di-GMP phosphodiesterase class II)
MQQPLFIHASTDFNSRIRKEAGSNALVTTSLLQALRFITNPELTIPAIYMSPNDTSYSALRFLELTLLQRPATPIFLIDDENEISTVEQKHFFENASIRGFFKKSDSYEHFLSVINPEANVAFNEITKRITTRSEHPSFLAIPIIDFAHAKTYPFDMFVEDAQKSLRLFATAGSPVEAEYLKQLAQKTSWIFVSENSIQETRTTIKNAQNSFMDYAEFPASWKTAETLFNAKVLLTEMKKGGLSDGFVEHTQFLLSDIYQIVSHLEGSERITDFIQQAKQCDRNIACATLAILMCKMLKFEKNAIVEILGLASIFQDISLHQSPFGDISLLKQHEMSPEIAKYHFYHATHSADFLAQSTSLPEVTLQVMRQHHERKDRTGFPNRAGGMQLHPMAEVLSLINEYLDHALNFESVEKEIYTHYSDRMVIAFKQLRFMISKSKTESKVESKIAA